MLHSVPVGTGASDLDHVVIGPAGVFTINTKHHRGQNVWVGAKRILVNGQRTDHLRNAAHEAKRASKLLVCRSTHARRSDADYRNRRSTTDDGA